MSEGIPVGPYRLVRRLATGGMAELFLARREAEGGFARELVVKRILPHLALSAEYRRMFRAEARLAALLTHPNIVQVYDYGSVTEDDAETLYLAMELVRGVDLQGLIGRAAEDRRAGAPYAVPPHHAAKIAALVCEGLAHAHSLMVDGTPAAIVHRDVTPSNVLISFDGAVKLADFGIAKGFEDGEVTAHGIVKGKHSYLSPEQARGAALDRRSDLFNVGILLFESILGESLYPESDPTLARQMARRGDIPDRMRIRRLPGPLADVAERALAARAVDRYPDALALRDDLEGFVRRSTEPSGSVELGRFVRASFPETMLVDRQRPRAAGTLAQADVSLRPQAQTRPTAAVNTHDHLDLDEGMIASETVWLGAGALDATEVVLAPSSDEASVPTRPRAAVSGRPPSPLPVMDDEPTLVAASRRPWARLGITVGVLLGLLVSWLAWAAFTQRS